MDFREIWEGVALLQGTVSSILG